MRASFNDIHRTTYNNTQFSSIIDALPPGSRELHIKQIANIQFWQRTNGVTVFPSSELVEKCTHTESLGSVCGSDIKMSFPTILFTLPAKQAFRVKAVHHPDAEGESHIGHLLVTVFDDSVPLTVTVDAEEDYRLHMPPGCRHLLVTAFWDRRFVNNFSVPLSDKTIRETLNDLRDHFIGDEVRLALMDQEGVREEQDETTQISEWACSMVVNLLLLMQSYPDFVQVAEDRHQRPHVYRNKPKPLTYTMSRVRDLLPPTVREGEITGESGRHNSPHAHWRRGHWRRQPHTPGWYAAAIEKGNAPGEVVLPDGRKAHMVWIEPVFVGLKGQDIHNVGIDAKV
jgi:hypothetical protein